MTIATTSTKSSVSRSDAIQSVPVSQTSEWTTVVAAGAATTADNSGSDITNPATQIAASGAERIILTREGSGGTYVQFRVKYATAPTTFPTIQVFGRTGTQAWERLKDAGGLIDFTFAAPSVALTDGTSTYSDATNPIDVRGCDEILIGVKTAAASGGASGLSIEGKIW